MRKRKKATLYYDVDHLNALDALSAETRVPKAVLVRIAIKRYLEFIESQRPTTHLLSTIDGDALADDGEE